MKVNKNIARLSLFALALALVSCNDFLNKYPDSRMDLKNPSEVSQLLVSAYPAAHPAYLTETFSDNTDEQLHSNWSAFDRFQEQAYNWKDIDEVRNAETPYQLWEAHYTAVATANEAIAHINGVNNPNDYDAQLGEALLCRAFAMFQLSTVFCQAYDKTTAQNNLGLPYPTEPEKVVGRLMERGTLEQLYPTSRKTCCREYRSSTANMHAPSSISPDKLPMLSPPDFTFTPKNTTKPCSMPTWFWGTIPHNCCEIGQNGTGLAEVATFSPTLL